MSLSPQFLLSILMTVLIREGDDKLHEQFGADRFGALGLGEMLYADDNVPMLCDGEVLLVYMQHISDCRAKYGLSSNGAKLESMVVDCAADFVNATGDIIHIQNALKYSKALLSCETCDTSEISRRIGIARRGLSLLKNFDRILPSSGPEDAIFIRALCLASYYMDWSQPLCMPMTNDSWTAFMQIAAVGYFASAARMLAE